MYYIDSIFSIGKDHKVCEDYVLIDKEKIPFIIVSDGCSSSDHTDIGSRIIAINAKNFVLEHYKTILNDKNYLIDIFRKAFVHSQSLLLKEESLDATLLFAFIYQEKLHYFAIGDGIISYKIGNKKITKNLIFNEEKVFYGNYYNNISRMAVYENANLDLEIETIEIENNQLSVTKELKKDYIFYETLDIDNLEYFFISTDGLLSCSSNEKISKKYYLDFLSFKNLRGDFIRRRYNMWKKNISKEGVNHQDDIGIAGFSFFKEL
jgi:hypothetical protein